jgi:hypothetical protein
VGPYARLVGLALDGAVLNQLSLPCSVVLSTQGHGDGVCPKVPPVSVRVGVLGGVQPLSVLSQRSSRERGRAWRRSV